MLDRLDQRVVFGGSAVRGVRIRMDRRTDLGALGAGGELKTAYMRTKGQAQAHLINLSIPSLIVRPSVVYGHDGDSAKMFRLLARMPIIAVPGQGES